MDPGECCLPLLPVQESISGHSPATGERTVRKREAGPQETSPGGRAAGLGSNQSGEELEAVASRKTSGGGGADVLQLTDHVQIMRTLFYQIGGRLSESRGKTCLVSLWVPRPTCSWHSVGAR